MSMPQIPEEKHRPCLEETVIDLLESIALEEIALSHLVNAESEKVQAFVDIIKNKNHCNKDNEFIEFNDSVRKMMDTVIMKEWLLLKKLENVAQFSEHMDKKDDCHSHEHCKHKKHFEEEYECPECNKQINVKVNCGCDSDKCDNCIKIKVKCECEEEFFDNNFCDEDDDD